VLGCIPKVRYCYESESDSFKAVELLQYEARRRNAAQGRGISSSATAGRCEPDSRKKVVLVRNVNRYGDSEFIHDTDQINNVLIPLFDKWQPDIFIHLSEVLGTIDTQVAIQSFFVLILCVCLYFQFL
jgi:hypothetical protein